MTEVLPDNWEEVALKSVVSKLVDGSHNPPKKQDSGKPMLSARNIENNEIVFDTYRYIDPDDFEAEHKRTRVKPDDVLLTIVGTIGRAAVVPPGLQDFTLQRSVAVLTPKGVLPKFLMYQLQAPHVQSYFEQNARGTAQKGVYLKTLGQTPVRVAPLADQKRIVAEIEKQFSRLDEAVANLKRVKANLKRYKAAVLKAAVEGTLTEEWRKAHPGVEPASKLLDRILSERRAKWEEAELAKMQAKGKAPKNDKWKGQYKEPVAPEATDLPELPESWAWARLDSIAGLKGGITVDSKRKDSTARDVPYLRVANVQRGFLDLNEVKTIKAPASAIEELRLYVGDILFNEGGDRDKLGRGWIWEGQLSECIHQNHVFRARLFLADIQPKLVSWWGNSFGKDYFLREGRQTTNLASINLTKLSAFPIPLPPSAEQHRIVIEVDRHLSLIRETEIQVDANLKRADRLRQSILTAAFAGRLRGLDSLRKPEPEHCFDKVAEPAVGYEGAP
jgi:type I restriction enzyme, S subunit